jgi:ABC-type transport system substrate-binding protein
VLLYNVQECLVKVDRNGKIVPWLAERWHTSTTGTTPSSCARASASTTAAS